MKFTNLILWSSKYKWGTKGKRNYLKGQIKKSVAQAIPHDPTNCFCQPFTQPVPQTVLTVSQ